jgi:hypothetical protein
VIIVADVPFLDVINTLLDTSLPLTAQEWEQWGSSPYDNVEKKAYPWLLVTTSLNDSQVMYWEARPAGTGAARGVTAVCGRLRSGMRSCWTRSGCCGRRRA